MSRKKTLRAKIAQQLVEHVKPILMLRWETTARALHNKIWDEETQTDSLKKAYLDGCQAGYWNGVTDGIDVGFDLGKREMPLQGDILH